jgi:hypothetical protein
MIVYIIHFNNKGFVMNKNIWLLLAVSSFQISTPQEKSVAYTDYKNMLKDFKQQCTPKTDYRNSYKENSYSEMAAQICRTLYDTISETADDINKKEGYTPKQHKQFEAYYSWWKAGKPTESGSEK